MRDKVPSATKSSSALMSSRAAEKATRLDMRGIRARMSAGDEIGCETATMTTRHGRDRSRACAIKAATTALISGEAKIDFRWLSNSCSLLMRCPLFPAAECKVPGNMVIG